MKTLLTNLFYSDGDEPQRGSLLLDGDRIERILAPDEAGFAIHIGTMNNTLTKIGDTRRSPQP